MADPENTLDRDDEPGAEGTDATDGQQEAADTIEQIRRPGAGDEILRNGWTRDEWDQFGPGGYGGEEPEPGGGEIFTL